MLNFIRAASFAHKFDFEQSEFEAPSDSQPQNSPFVLCAVNTLWHLQIYLITGFPDEQSQE